LLRWVDQAAAEVLEAGLVGLEAPFFTALSAAL
jgi:hypothetical protein